MNDDLPQWDTSKVERLDGAVVLVGMTWIDPAGKRLEQFFGTVISVDERIGITLRLGGFRSGETFCLPPDLRAFFPAAPGSYRLHQSGEVVVDPDFTTTWEHTSPKN